MMKTGVQEIPVVKTIVGAFALCILVILAGRGITASSNPKSDPALSKRAESAEKIEWMTSTELANLYHDNEVAADEIVKKSKLAITGRVKSITKDFKGEMWLHLAGEQGFFSRVDVTFTDEHKSELLGIRSGETITISCKSGQEVLNFVMLSDCQCVNGLRLGRHYGSQDTTMAFEPLVSQAQPESASPEQIVGGSASQEAPAVASYPSLTNPAEEKPMNVPTPNEALPTMETPQPASPDK